MASKQSEANRKHYETLAALAVQEPPSPEAVIEWGDVHWTALTAEPGGVDYIEVDAGGVQAMSIVPKGCIEDRVIFRVHGGGYVSGSIYTHRKMYGHLAKAIACRALVFNYGYAHQNVYPAQLNQTLFAYRWLLDQGVRAEHIAIAADSCCAALTFGALLAALPVEAIVRPERQRDPELLQLLRRYVELFNCRDWDGVRALTTADARLRVSDCFKGLLRQSPYFVEYERAETPWKMAVGEIDGETVLVVLTQRDDGWVPAWPVRIRAIGGVIDHITDYYACPWMMPAAGSVLVAGTADALVRGKDEHHAAHRADSHGRK